MTTTVDTAFQTTASADAFGALALVELQFKSGTARFTNWPLSVQVMGHSWMGIGNLGEISQLHESEDGGEEKVQLKLSPADVDVRALSLGDPSEYQDRPVRIWIAVLDASTMQISGAPVLRFSGVMDQAKIDRENDGATITMECRTASYDVRSNPAALRMNNAQHQARHPGERGFEYLSDLIGNPAVWLSVKFQKKLRGL